MFTTVSCRVVMSMTHTIRVVIFEVGLFDDAFRFVGRESLLRTGRRISQAPSPAASFHPRLST